VETRLALPSLAVLLVPQVQFSAHFANQDFIATAVSAVLMLLLVLLVEYLVLLPLVTITPLRVMLTLVPQLEILPPLPSVLGIQVSFLLAKVDVALLPSTQPLEVVITVNLAIVEHVPLLLAITVLPTVNADPTTTVLPLKEVANQDSVLVEIAQQITTPANSTWLLIFLKDQAPALALLSFPFLKELLAMTHLFALPVSATKLLLLLHVNLQV